MSELKVHATMINNEHMAHIEKIRADFSLRLKQALREAGISDWGSGKYLADITGKTPKAASKWLNAESMPGRASMAAIGQALNVETSWLQYGTLSVSEPGPKYVGRHPGKVPVISWVAAGQWCDSTDPYSVGDASEWVLCPFPFGENAFCLSVVGDSMFPEYREGEYILVDPSVEARHNDDVVARTPEQTYTFKRLQITPDGTYLLALNPEHPDRRIKIPPDSQICGVVTGSWQKRR